MPRFIISVASLLLLSSFTAVELASDNSATADQRLTTEQKRKYPVVNLFVR